MSYSHYKTYTFLCVFYLYYHTLKFEIAVGMYMHKRWYSIGVSEFGIHQHPQYFNTCFYTVCQTRPWKMKSVVTLRIMLCVTILLCCIMGIFFMYSTICIYAPTGQEGHLLFQIFIYKSMYAHMCTYCCQMLDWR